MHLMIIIKLWMRGLFFGFFFFNFYFSGLLFVASLNWCEKLAVVVILKFKPLNIEHWTRLRNSNNLFDRITQVIRSYYVIGSRESEDGNREALFKKINIESEYILFTFHVPMMGKTMVLLLLPLIIMMIHLAKWQID